MPQLTHLQNGLLHPPPKETMKMKSQIPWQPTVPATGDMCEESLGKEVWVPHWASTCPSHTKTRDLNRSSSLLLW